MYNPQTALSENLRVKETPIKADEAVFFKLINADKIDMSRDDGKGTYLQPEVYQISDRITVTDPYAKGGPRKVVIGNVVGANPVELPDGNTVMKEALKGVQFIRGYAKVSSADWATYCYLMRRPDNDSNPFRKAMGGKKVLFKKVEEKKEINDLLMLEDMAYQAQKIVRETKDPVKIKSIAAALNKGADQRYHIPSYQPGVREDIPAIKLELIQRAKSFPKAVIYASGDEIAKVKIQVMEAMNFGIVIYNEKAFFLVGKEYKQLLQTEPDSDKVDQLVDFFTSEEGGKLYAEFAQLLTKAMSGSRA